MKKIATIIIIFSVLFQSCKNEKRIITAINNVSSIELAEKFIQENPELKSKIVSLSEKDDSLEVTDIFLTKKIGDFFEVKALETRKKSFFKVLSIDSIIYYRAIYIFLDGNILSDHILDSLKKDIIKQYESGEVFTSLAKKYTMDGNLNGGDTDWFEKGIMMEAFEEAIKIHQKDEVFTVNIPENRWYYIVKKTHTPKIYKKYTYLAVQINS